MKNYVGIDLGTTNSAICSFDGENVHLYKSPDQTDVTPSAIFVDRRGNRYVGLRAYNNAARNPENAALLFKRLMGTSTPVKLPAVGLTMTPEECSAEVLRTLFGYLPEAIRNDDEVGTVITVPAAFNQMQKDATMEAARSAGLGKVALMQEPVAAVMSVMRSRQGDGIFLVYDIGGGTLDIAIAQSVGGRVSLLGQGGIPMCGGRDFDRIIFDNLIMPWAASQFDIGADFVGSQDYVRFRRMAEFAAERAKIELSSRDEAMIAATESECSARDTSGQEMYIDVPVTRSQIDQLFHGKIQESIQAARETIEKAGLTPHDIQRVVFVGGPTQYKPLRDLVAFELGIAGSTDVNPMTAVAAGAAVFAESIDWSSHSRSRKSARGSIDAGSGLNVLVNFPARTPDQKTKIGLKLGAPAPAGSTFQVDSLDTGWSSGRAPLKDGTILEVPLAKPGENTFKLFVFDPSGGPVALGQDRIVITRTAATIDAIPASHSIGIEVREKGDQVVIDYLVRAGDQLPARGKRAYKAGESLRANAPNSLRFKVWEGDIAHPISDNTFVGLFEISGNDFESGVIPAGADLFLTYEISDAGTINMEVTVPSIGGEFRNSRNFYSRNAATVDFSQAAKRIHEDAESTARHIAELAAKVDDDALAAARERVDRASAIPEDETNPETAKQAMEDIQRAKQLLAAARKANLKTIRRMELDSVTEAFNNLARPLAKPNEVSAFDNLLAEAERALPSPGAAFESRVDELRGKIFSILARQEWFLVDRFNWYAESPHLFADARAYALHVADGRQAIAVNDINGLRGVLGRMEFNRIAAPGADDLVAVANIVRA
ncbi:Hsp70 family protein [Salinarimonas soli]|uniref:Hsp70 family protein n=1 Tax=Salinarimonas soli TaxID=1638099 RepID=A0A5B2VC59_9HYPH|nr:Hsp70 family protein [Salinarimonas soli]KAA2235879.1 Hsp70 family protein [Salinarimonas soli]